MEQVVSDLLARRRDRAIAIVLGFKEKECDRHLPPDVRAKLRKVILDQMNDLTDLAADIIRSMDTGGVVLNEMWLAKIDTLYEHVMNGSH